MLDDTFATRLLCFDTVLSKHMPENDFTELEKLVKFVYTKMTINEIGDVLVSYRHSKTLNFLK